jgi:uncharacterized membrane protein YagU involved in acid resistance
MMHRDLRFITSNGQGAFAMARQTTEPNLWKGILAGMVGGLVAAWVMTEFQSVLSGTAKTLPTGRLADEFEARQKEEMKSTTDTADQVSIFVRGKKLTKSEKEKAAPVIHYAFGALMGGIYGATVEMKPEVKTMSGIRYGTALFVGADRIVLPALGLSKPPASFPFSHRAYGFASHLVYGTTAELVRRIVRRFI